MVFIYNINPMKWIWAEVGIYLSQISVMSNTSQFTCMVIRPVWSAWRVKPLHLNQSAANRVAASQREPSREYNKSVCKFLGMYCMHAMYSTQYHVKLRCRWLNSVFIRVKVCCLTTQSHYLNQSLFMVSLGINLTGNTPRKLKGLIV